MAALLCSAVRTWQHMERCFQLLSPPPPHDAQAALIFLDCGIVEEESWLHTWFRIQPEHPPVLVLCPSALTLLRLQFKPALLQCPPTLECITRFRFWIVAELPELETRETRASETARRFPAPERPSGENEHRARSFLGTVW